MDIIERPTGSDAPEQAILPTRSQRLRSTAIAGGVALLLLIIAVLPAEYAIDPTGLGRILGLTQIGRMASALSIAAPQGSAAVALKSDVTKVTLGPNESTEVKLSMAEGARVSFQWSVEGGEVNYDLHADRPGGRYHGYGKGKGVSADKGELVAAFDGWHGWFWRNRSKGDVTLTLETKGDYRAVKEMK